MIGRYPAKQIQAAILLWQHYLGVASDIPEIRNPKTWAGAIEYCLSRLLAIPVTQKSLAETYNVSAPSISRVYKIISKQIDLNSLDKNAFLS
jgi:transcription initiation factor TFIIIB Brf1 subunit/transcription initiation factor TFIIB